MKLGRNEPCWCKSGKKYKRCHLGRSDAQSIPLSEALNATKQAQKGGACSCPNEMISECSGDPIRSHSISKALGLSKISDNGHVLTLKSDIKTLSKNKGKIQVGKIDINKMSIFPGFCSFHDKSFLVHLKTITSQDQKSSAHCYPIVPLRENDMRKLQGWM